MTPSRTIMNVIEIIVMVICIFGNTILVCQQIPNCNGGNGNDLIKTLPGLKNYNSTFPTMYSGFVQVNKSANGSLFYWFIEALSSTNSTKQSIPLLVWLNGGPGASSLTGLFAENGPFRINNDLTLSYNNNTWIANYHMLYIDNPIGTGFSFCNDGNWVTSNEQLAIQFVTFLDIWFSNECHSEYNHNPFYLTGESHAGKYIPFIATYIIQSNINNISNINLIGLVVGNGYSNPIIMYESAPLYAFNLGIIDLNQLNTTRKEINSCFNMINIDPSIATDICTEAIDIMYNDYGGNIFIYNIYYLSSSFWENIKQNLAKYLNQTELKNAIHVYDIQWKSSDGTEEINPVAEALKPDMMINNSWSLYTSLLKYIRILFYNGNLDGSVCNNFGNQNSINQLNYNGDWLTLPKRAWHINNNNNRSLAGYVKTSADKQLTYFVVLDSGHLVPFDQPYNILNILENWVNNGSWTK